jgi:hypothetical protein
MSNDRREQLLDAIDREIEDAQRVEERSGWTTWALLGAGASLFWFGTEIFKQNLSRQIVVHAFIAFVFAFQSVWPLLANVVRAPTSVSDIRFTPNTVFFSGWPVVVTNMLLNVVTVVLLLYARSGIPVVAIVTPVTLLIVNVFLLVGAFVWMLKDFPTPAGAHGRVRRTVHVTSVVFSLVYGFSALPHILWLVHSNSVPVDAIRLAAIGFAAYLLIPKAVALNEESPLERDLRELRREILFGDLSDDEGYRRADTIISGMRATEVMQRAISRVLSDYEKHRTSLRSIRDAIDTLSQRLVQSEQSDSPDEAFVNSAQVSATEIRSRTILLAKDLEKTMKLNASIKAKGMLVIGLAPASEPDVTRVVKDLETTFAEFHSEAIAAMAALEAVDLTISRLGSAQLSFATQPEACQGGE